MSTIVDEKRQTLEAYEQLCADAGLPPGHVALAWLLAQPVVTAPIIGPRTPEQLADVLGVPEVVLDDDLLARLDDLFPGSGGPAPEAYAW